ERKQPPQRKPAVQVRVQQTEPGRYAPQPVRPPGPHIPVELLQHPTHADNPMPMHPRLPRRRQPAPLQPPLPPPGSPGTPPPPPSRGPPPRGGGAQRGAAAFTRQKSQVRSVSRPPAKTLPRLNPQDR